MYFLRQAIEQRGGMAGCHRCRKLSASVSSDMVFERLSGFFPMYLRGELTGFECYREDVPDVRDKVPDIDIGHDWTFVLVFV